MMTLLIVDDEMIIAEGLRDTLQEVFREQLTVRCCTSANAAREILLKNRVDILMTDINMPNTTGLELHRWVSERWPQLRVIYLTGYSDFEYAREALNNNAAAFILKSDGDRVLIGAVEKTMRDLEERNRWLLDSAGDGAETPQRLRQLVFHALYGGVVTRSQIREATSGRMQPDLPVYLGYGCFRKNVSPGLLSRTQKLIRSLTGKALRLETVELTARSFAMLFQPECEEGKDLLLGHLEMVQEILKETEECLTVCVMSEPTDWLELNQAGQRLLHDVNLHSLTGGELLTAGEDTPTISPARTGSDREDIGAMACAGRMNEYLMTGQQDLFFEEERQLWPVMDAIGKDQAARLFHIVTACMAELGASLDGGGQLQPELERLRDAAWEERDRENLRKAFCDLAARLFRLKRENQNLRLKRLVERIDAFITDNLAGELSLTVIADRFHFHPSYLSRIYKESTGTSLSDSIAARRLNRARELLRQDDCSIANIAAMTGFTSPNYFSRWFRKWTGQTPQEYRDQSL